MRTLTNGMITNNLTIMSEKQHLRRFYWTQIIDQANQRVIYFKRLFARYKRSKSVYSPDEILMEVERYQRIAIFGMKRKIQVL
jgi:hypothetical protein